MSEKDFEAGKRVVLTQLVLSALKELGYEKVESLESLIIQREETVHVLRQICTQYGDNDWNSELPLGHVLKEHLWNHLITATEERGEE